MFLTEPQCEQVTDPEELVTETLEDVCVIPVVTALSSSDKSDALSATEDPFLASLTSKAKASLVACTF